MDVSIDLLNVDVKKREYCSRRKRERDQLDNMYKCTTGGPWERLVVFAMRIVRETMVKHLKVEGLRAICKWSKHMLDD